jgi:hypothetical protein
MELQQINPIDFDVFVATPFTVIDCETFNSVLTVLAKEGDAVCTHAQTLNHGLQKCGCASPNSTHAFSTADDMPAFFGSNITAAPVVVCTVCPSGHDDEYVNATKEFSQLGCRSPRVET